MSRSLWNKIAIQKTSGICLMNKAWNYRISSWHFLFYFCVCFLYIFFLSLSARIFSPVISLSVEHTLQYIVYSFVRPSVELMFGRIEYTPYRSFVRAVEIGVVVGDLIGWMFSLWCIFRTGIDRQQCILLESFVGRQQRVLHNIYHFVICSDVLYDALVHIDFHSGWTHFFFIM